MMQGWFIVIIFAVYAVVITLTILVLWRLIILLPVLTKLVVTMDHFFRGKVEAGNRSPDLRLLDLEDMLRLKKITPEEYAAKRQEILNDL
jgi:hypothetical protein